MPTDRQPHDPYLAKWKDGSVHIIPGLTMSQAATRAGTGMNGSEFCKKAMHEAGVAIVPGTAFGKTSIDYVRFSYAASQDNISNALENIKKMLG